MRRWLLVMAALDGCTGDGTPVVPPAPPASSIGPPVVSCAAPLPIFAGGRETGRICPEEAPASGLTIVVLSDDWVPLILRDDPAADAALRQPYHATFVALANEQPGRGPEWDRARQDGFLELYGIVPSMRVVAARLSDDERHICHSFVDSSAVQALTRTLYLAETHTPAERAALAALDRRLICERLLPATAQPRPRWRLEAALEAYQRK